MSAEKPADLFGIQPLSKSVEIATDGTVRGLGAFLSRVCLPASEEFGLLLQDRVKGWRAENLAAMEHKAAKKYEALYGPKNTDAHAHPRIVSQIADGASWEDNEDVQELWAGLLATSCSPDGGDQSNLLYVGILSRITPTQATLINTFCKRCVKTVSPAGVVITDDFEISIYDLTQIIPSVHLEQVDAELDALREIGLLNMLSGIGSHSGRVTISVSGLALNFYARCQGFLGGPIAFFKL